MNKPGFFALHRLLSPCLAVLCLLLAPAVANATPYVVKMVQQGNDVVATGSGEFDLTGLVRLGASSSFGGFVSPKFGSSSVGQAAPIDVYSYGAFTGPTAYGPGNITLATSSSGDPVFIAPLGGFGIPSPFLIVPRGYVSFTGLLGDATWSNATFASLGVTPGTYVWTWGSGAGQSYTLDIVVPEPAALGMFGLGVLLIGAFVGLRRRVA